ncbi:MULTISPECIES: hypothetical protein [unclassified Tenacibaculum]|uniref:hypothetical protein n=1 Tax=unclassified Tenacibaculum TaxID=2635139 RepID=UPI001F22524B|nr:MULTISPECIES: hypothetical protein [unclassified Tenacibaculum]MCF2875403.1 hypothetical protein [Tenacibaculum sp. Cn5-1]MCF2935479.1 hypothetical protein [Tenacibaculum sp. Cn5-34]MCG7512039.1 hypothetical protein [Tenacibaculum sp. Cn5-46]
MGDNKRKKEILEKLNQTSQIDLNDKIEQIEILENQQKEIDKYKTIGFNNFIKIFG